MPFASSWVKTPVRELPVALLLPRLQDLCLRLHLLLPGDLPPQYRLLRSWVVELPGPGSRSMLHNKMPMIQRNSSSVRIYQPLIQSSAVEV